MTENKKIETWIKQHQEFSEEILSNSNINEELGSELGGNFENYLASADLENSERELEVGRTLTKAVKNILEREKAEKKLTGEVPWGYGESNSPEHDAWIVRLKDKLAELEEIKTVAKFLFQSALNLSTSWGLVRLVRCLTRVFKRSDSLLCW